MCADIHTLSTHISAAAFTVGRFLPKFTCCVFLCPHMCLHTLHITSVRVWTAVITFPPVRSLRSRRSVWRAGSFWPPSGQPARETVLLLSEPPASPQPVWRAAPPTSTVHPPGNAARMAVDTLAKRQPTCIKVKVRSLAEAWDRCCSCFTKTPRWLEVMDLMWLKDHWYTITRLPCLLWHCQQFLGSIPIIININGFENFHLWLI